MPRKISEKDRILAYAFTATPEQLEDAVSIFQAALRAKKGPRKVVATKSVVKPLKTQPIDGQTKE